MARRTTLAQARRPLTLPAPAGFRFATTVRSHGWYALPPFAYDGEKLTFALELDGRAHDVVVDERLRIDCDVDDPRVARAVAVVLGLDEDLEPLYRLTDKLPRLRWARAAGAGRLLRAPTVLEDVVKIVCTTNCTWSFTTRMIERIVDGLGSVAPSGRRAFPAAAALASAGESFFRDQVRAGYRAPHLYAIASRVADGSLDLEGLRAQVDEPARLAKALRTLPGVGPYAAAHLLRLLGSGAPDHLGLDSWCRERLAAIYPRARDVDAAAARRYARFGRWAGHAMWLDVTADWHA